ncbi:rCG41196 [Rattus norvegicus]|uniref:RCG41196 n=1 Tax=Rattus norvegicus TaxID=10116 RepID=A6KMT2_RAT|nr:rCG41196 [Rattus norvegicus]
MVGVVQTIACKISGILRVSQRTRDWRELLKPRPINACPTCPTAGEGILL